MQVLELLVLPVVQLPADLLVAPRAEAIKDSVVLQVDFIVFVPQLVGDLVFEALGLLSSGFVAG